MTWLYLLTRYYGLVKNSVNIVLLTRPITGIISDAQCESAYSRQICLTFVSLILHLPRHFQMATGLGFDLYSAHRGDFGLARVCCKSIVVPVGMWTNMRLVIRKLYNKSRYVGAGLFLIMLANLGVQIKTMTVVFPIPEPPGVILPCIAIGPNEWLVAFWVINLSFKLLDHDLLTRLFCSPCLSFSTPSFSPLPSLNPSSYGTATSNPAQSTPSSATDSFTSSASSP